MEPKEEPQEKACEASTDVENLGSKNTTVKGAEMAKGMFRMLRKTLSCLNPCDNKGRSENPLYVHHDSLHLSIHAHGMRFENQTELLEYEMSRNPNLMH